jgi:2'-5' RNA ligase
MARLFIAVWPPEDVVADLLALHRKDRRGVRFLPPDRWHVTLRFLGEADPADVADAMGDVADPATARLGPAVDIVGGRVLAVPVAGLHLMAGALETYDRPIAA